MDRQISSEKAIRQLVAASVQTFSKAFSERHITEYDDPDGTLNMKIHNVFIAALGEELQYYTAMCRSFDSSLGNMLETLAINIAKLFYTVSQEITGELYPEQTAKIAELLEAYKNRLNSCEIMLCCWNKKHKWNFTNQKEMHNFFETQICSSPERLKKPKHPTQKPVKLLEHIIKIASNENDTVFDPFMGVASTGVAALKNNRKFVGIELEESYFKASEKRLVNLKQMKDIFGNTEVELKPFLKWPGGKTKELKVIIPNLPEKIENYYEPFIGGGAVYFAVNNAKHYFINDKSKDLVDLYQNIKSDNNKELFNTLSEIDNYWKKLDNIFENHKLTLNEIFFSLRKFDDFDIKTEIKQFVDNNISDFTNPIQTIFGFDLKFYARELKVNLTRKMSRMRQLEKEMGLLSDADIDVNILTAIKSSFYMYFRMLYNKHEKYNIPPIAFSAIYFFIRNYTYSGMFRYNADGEFNVPYGGIGYNGNSLDKKIKYISGNEIQQRLKNTTIENADFYDFMK